MFEEMSTGSFDSFKYLDAGSYKKSVANHRKEMNPS
jgi:hypothetical protein